MAGEIAAAVEDINEGSEVHGWVLMTDDEMVNGMWEGSEEGHKSKIYDERKVNKHNRVDEENIFAFFSPFFAKEEKVDGYEDDKV